MWYDMKIFISWSKNKSRQLAEVTKNFLEKTLGNSVEFFFSPEMYKGTSVDHEIHKNLLESSKCLVCVTSENFKNPWLLYEAGVVYGANHQKTKDGIVIPILFEEIPEWSSWIDKPLNRYVPIQIQNYNHEFGTGKTEFKKFLEQTAKSLNIKLKQFNLNWEKYEYEIKQILKKEQIIPIECKELVNKLLENDNNSFSIVSPDISKEHIIFHKGFTTHALMKILTDSITEFEGKYLWFYGRKNKKLLSREYDDFFKYLADEGLYNGVDFRCLFPLPGSDASFKASSKDREKIFNYEMQISLTQAYKLKNKFGLPVEKLFRLYIEPRKESIIRCDNAVIYRQTICDTEGYPLPYTNSNFEIFSALENEDERKNKGFNSIKKFEEIWSDNARSVPLTEELLVHLYGENF